MPSPHFRRAQRRHAALHTQPRSRSQKACRKWYRPLLELLEDRTLSAFNLTISRAATMGVTVLNGNFTANAPGANINVGEIRAALVNGFDVVVSNGNIGGENGNITWNRGNLDYDTTGLGRSLVITADPSSLVGNFTFGAAILDGTPGGDSLDVAFTARNTLTLNGSIDAANITLTANEMNIANQIHGAGASVTLQPTTAGRPITLGPENVASLDLQQT